MKGVRWHLPRADSWGGGLVLGILVEAIARTMLG